MRPVLDVRIAAIAAAQLGLVTHDQALADGATPRIIQRRVTAKLWVVVFPGVYALAGAPAGWHQDLLAACLATSSTAVASHRAAARLWALPGFEQGRVEVSVHGDRWHRLHGVACHRSRDLAPGDRTTIGPIPVTRIERTLIDVARYTPAARLEEAIDAAVARRVTTYRRIERRFTQLARRGRPGIATMRDVLESRSPTAVAPESVQERRLLRSLESAGLPPPVPQYEIRERGRLVARVDAAYPDRQIAVEYDSFRFHGGRRQHERDARRANRLRALGWEVIVATAADLRSDADGTLHRAVRRALERRDERTA
jgi:hypothetical protein